MTVVKNRDELQDEDHWDDFDIYEPVMVGQVGVLRSAVLSVTADVPSGPHDVSPLIGSDKDDGIPAAGELEFKVAAACLAHLVNFELWLSSRSVYPGDFQRCVARAFAKMCGMTHREIRSTALTLDGNAGSARNGEATVPMYTVRGLSSEDNLTEDEGSEEANERVSDYLEMHRERDPGRPMLFVLSPLEEETRIMFRLPEPERSSRALEDLETQRSVEGELRNKDLTKKAIFKC